MKNITVGGRLTRDAEFRESDNGGYLRFSLAADQYIKGEKSAMFFNCVMFGQRGQKLQGYMLKGKFLVASGDLTLEPYTGKSGEEKQSLCIRVGNITLGPKTDSESSSGSGYGAGPDTAPGGSMGDDLPF